MNFIEALKEVEAGKVVTAPSLMNLRKNEDGRLEWTALGKVYECECTPSNLVFWAARDNWTVVEPQRVTRDEMLKRLNTAHTLKYVGSEVLTIDVLRDKTKCWEIVD